MKTKTLDIIQKINKVAMILSKVVFILCIVGAGGCVIGLLTMAFGPWSIEVDGVTLRELVEKEANISVEAAGTYCFIGLLACACEGFIAKMAEKYFKNELKAGTPFTIEGSKELFKLSIYLIATPIVMSIIGGIIIAIATAIIPNMGNEDLDLGFDLGLGLMLMFASLLMKLGAEQNQKNKEVGEVVEAE